MAINRLGLTPFEFYQLVPVELEYALKDYKQTQFTPMKRICETVRIVGQVVHNSALGREKKDMLRRPSELVRFSWEDQPHIQTVEEMKRIILGLAHVKGVTVKQKGKEVKFEEPDASR